MMMTNVTISAAQILRNAGHGKRSIELATLNW